jgi:hypothetical protein
MGTLWPSEWGRATIKQAREARGWVVREEDTTPLKEASKFLIQQHAAKNGWCDNDLRWLKDFDRLFRVEKHIPINHIRTRLAQSRQGSLVQRLEQLIDTGEIFVKDISYGSWSRFASQTRLHGIRARAFKAYCHVLGLNWEEIADLTDTQELERTQANKAEQLQTQPTSGIGSLLTHPYHNLPVRYHTALIGRETEMIRLLELLSCDRPTSHISVEGIGGAGKTSLVLEAAYRCLQASCGEQTTPLAPTFDAIIFTSAKQQHLIGNTILQRHRRERTLNDIFRAIFRTLQCPGSLPADFDQQIECIQNHLEKRQTLLIVDNLETLDDQEAVLAFLYELPPTVKVVITTRVRGAFGIRIYLECLHLNEALRLIEHQAKEQSVLLKPTQFQGIYERTSGLPLGIVYAIGQLSVYGVSTDALATRLIQANSDLALYCFEDSVQRLRGQLAHYLLMGLALFVKSASLDAIESIALPKADSNHEVNPKSQIPNPKSLDQTTDGTSLSFEGEKLGVGVLAASKNKNLPPASVRGSASSPEPLTLTAEAYLLPPTFIDFLDALAQLYRLRLVMQRGERYDMHPLTREYAVAELRTHPEFEQQAREGWVNWYLNFCEPYRQPNWRQWHDYQNLDREWENLQAVIDWCIQQNRYEDIKTFWQQVKGYTYLHGYWHERLTWIDWLLQAAQQRQDKSAIAEALIDKGWTLTLMGKPERLAEVDALFEQVSHLQDGEDLLLQLELTIDRAVLSIHQRQFERARYFLNQGRELLKRVQIEQPTAERQQIRIDYYEAEVWFGMGNYAQAKIGYQKALEQARTAQCQQLEVYILNWLADVALAGEHNLNEAEQLLKTSMPIALERKDKISIAFHKRSWAHLEKLRGNLAQFQNWAIEAAESFESLGMVAEAQEIQSWLS